MKNPVSPDQRRFIIVESDPIVSLDLAGALESAFPKSDISVSQLMSDGASKMDAQDLSKTSILLNARLLSDATLALLRDCASRCAKVVVIGEVGTLDFEAVTVDVPFTSEMVLNAIA